MIFMDFLHKSLITKILSMVLSLKKNYILAVLIFADMDPICSISAAQVW